MVSLSPSVDPRDAAALRQDAEAVAAASADLAAQIGQIAALDQRFLTLLADTAHGPIRVTLATGQVMQALEARLATLDAAANALRGEALALERIGIAGATRQNPAEPDRLNGLRWESAELGRALGQGG